MRTHKLSLLLLCGALALAKGSHAQEACPDPTPNAEATPLPTPVPGPKAWDAGTGLGVVLDEDGKQATYDDGQENTGDGVDHQHMPLFDGRMTAPQNQTVPASQWKTPTVKVGSAPLSCGVENVSDFDHWKKADNDGKDCTKDPEGNENDGVKYHWTGGTFDHPDSASPKWTVPTTPGRYVITCTMDDTPTVPADPETGSRDDASISVSCTVIVYKLSVQFVENEVAAGAVGNESHQAKFDVIASDGTAGVPDVSVDVPEVTDGGQGADDSITAKTAMDSTTTDSNGKARGTFTSGNRTQDTTISVYNLSPEDKESSSIKQVWNSNSDPWTYDEYAYYDEPSPVAYSMSYSRGPINGHAMHFENVDIQGWEFFPASFDFDGDGILDDAYWPQEFNKNDSDHSGWDAYNGLSEWSDVSEVSSGTYQADQTIYYDDQFIMSYVTFDIYDDVTYDAN